MYFFPNTNSLIFLFNVYIFGLDCIFSPVRKYFSQSGNVFSRLKENEEIQIKKNRLSTIHIDNRFLKTLYYLSK